MRLHIIREGEKINIGIAKGQVRWRMASDSSEHENSEHET
jgi:hypothetical protein